MPHKVALKAKAKLWVQPQVEGGAGVAGATVASPSTVTQMSKWGNGGVALSVGVSSRTLGDNVQRQLFLCFPPEELE